MITRLIATTLLLTSSAALADIRVVFSEGAPKDRFSITNIGACSLDTVQIVIDLSGSPAGLIFDVTGEGAGVEVYQPFELTAGHNMVSEIPLITNGQAEISLSIDRFAPSAEVAFTIDVDDTAGNREITVNGSEIAGATVRIDQAEAAFTNDATAIIPLDGCNA